MLKRKKYKIYPPILSNKGQITDDIWLSGPLSINDIDNVLISEPPNDGDSLVYSASMGAWVNEPVSSSLPWLSESHIISDSSSTNNIHENTEYAGYSKNGYGTWDNNHWDSEFDATDSPLIINGFNRPLPIDNVKKIRLVGSTSVIDTKYTTIKIYLTPCYDNVPNTFQPFYFPTLLETYFTPQYTAGLSKDPGISCFDFEIDIESVLSRLASTGDRLLISVIPAADPSTTKRNSLSLGEPFIINYSISLEN